MLGSFKLLLFTALLVVQLSHAERIVPSNALVTTDVSLKPSIDHYFQHSQQQQEQPYVTVPLTNNIVVFQLFAEPGTEQAKIERDQFLQTLQDEGIPFQLRHTYDLGISALSMLITDADADKIMTRHWARKRWKPILLSFPVVKKQKRGWFSTPERSHIEPSIIHLHKKGFTGKNIKIGILDDGIYYKHEALGGCFGKGCRVAYGQDYVGDNYDGTKDAEPNPTPLGWCLGHGTHVAGIAAGNGVRMTGIAPEATLGAYRIISCNHQGSSEFVAIALQQAVKDGMDIINISLAPYEGAELNMRLSNTIAAILKLNIIVVTTACNTGSQGLWHTQIFGDNPDVISVGAVASPVYESDWFAITDDMSRLFPYEVMCRAEKPSGEFQLVAIQPVINEGKCSLPPNVDVKNKIVHFLENSCNHLDLYKQLKDMKTNKAAGLLVNISEIEPHSSGSAMFCSYNRRNYHVSHSLVLMGMLPDRFYAFTNELGGRTSVNIKLSRSKERFGEINRIFMSYKSAWGPDRHLSFKPDVVAPGVDIFSTFSNAPDNYETKSGTSTATPYVTGAIALYLQHRRNKPRKTPAEIRQFIQNAAYPIFSKYTEDIAPIAHQGAGFIDVQRMITGKIRVSPSAIPLGDSNNKEWPKDNKRRVTLSVTNMNTVARKFYVTYHPMPAIRTIEDPVTHHPIFYQSKAYASVKHPTSSIIIDSGATKEVIVTISEPRNIPNSENWVYSGYIVIDTRPIFHLSAPTDSTVFVPLLGLKGSIKNVLYS